MKTYIKQIPGGSLYGIEFSPPRTTLGVQFSIEDLGTLASAALILDTARDVAAEAVAAAHPELDNIPLSETDPELDQLLASPWAGILELLGSLVDGKLHVSERI